jgi:sugar/nucleoside kinase (ribokinase family)
MITIVGTLEWRPTEPAGPAGRACGIALAAAAAGARVELVGRVGDDPAGDQLLLSLARASVGHAAVLRDPARPTPVAGPPEPGDEDPFTDAARGAAGADRAAPVDGPRLEPEDVALGLSYLTEFDVLVVTDTVPPGILPVAVEAASFAGAQLVVLVRAAHRVPEVPARAVVLETPGVDDGAFGQLVGRMCASLDRGLAPDVALRGAVADGGWEPTPDDAA